MIVKRRFLVSGIVPWKWKVNESIALHVRDPGFKHDDAMPFRTFVSIVSAYPYCARNSCRNVTPRHVSSARSEKTFLQHLRLVAAALTWLRFYSCRCLMTSVFLYIDRFQRKDFRANVLIRFLRTSPGGGGVLVYFLGGYVPSETPNWHPVLKTNCPKIDTPF